jgi:hypothetical protein
MELILVSPTFSIRQIIETFKEKENAQELLALCHAKVSFPLSIYVCARFRAYVRLP